MRREDIQSWIRWLRINKASRPVYAELANFMVHTGARISEACGLHWDAVDLQSGIASIIRTVWWDRHSRKPSIQNSSKTDGSVRIIHLPGPVITMLREMKLRSKPEAPVFAGQDGAYLGHPAIQSAFNLAFTSLGMPGGPPTSAAIVLEPLLSWRRKIWWGSHSKNSRMNSRMKIFFTPKRSLFSDR